MTRHDPRVRLLHMLNHAREAVAIAQEESSESLRRKRQSELSLTGLVGLVGGAASAVPPDVRQRRPRVRWSALAELGHSVRHDYDCVDLDAVWRAVRDDFPVLIEEVERELLQDASAAHGSLSEESGEALRREIERLRGHWRSPSEAGLAGLARGFEDGEELADDVERAVRARTSPRSLDELDPDR
jgi:uncharacterized protein with HEPN domain